VDEAAPRVLRRQRIYVRLGERLGRSLRTLLAPGRFLWFLLLLLFPLLFQLLLLLLLQLLLAGVLRAPRERGRDARVHGGGLVCHSPPRGSLGA
jgi:hypothetical protein